LLATVVVLAVVYIVLQRRRRHYAVRFTNLDLLSSVAPRRPGWRRHVAAALIGLGLISMVVALARPVRTVAVARDHATLMLVVDVSASMEATDVSPTRLQAAIAAAEAFVAKIPAAYEVGLVAYDNTPRVLTTPTTDRTELLAALAGLTTGPGTATGDAIDVAVQTITAHLAATSGTTAVNASATVSAPVAADKTAAIVLLSDGKSTVGSSVESGEKTAVAAGIPVTTIAYGTQSGTVSVDGQTVAVPADETTMQAIASATGGASFTATDTAELREAYQNIQQHVGYTHEQRDILRWFVVIAVIALLLGVLASMLWTGRFL
jgi:Ca-activated chloride channel family protein